LFLYKYNESVHLSSALKGFIEHSFNVKRPFTINKKIVGLLGMAKRIIIAVTNDLVTDQRIGRVANTLVDDGYEVYLVGRLLPHSLPIVRPYKTKRFKLWFKKGPLFYVNYNLQLFFFLLLTPFDAVLSNDLDTLLASFMAAKLKRKQLVYDSHEYFTEVPELVGRKFQQNAWLFIEKMLLPRIDYAYTVSESIANEYHQKYGKTFHVIRNLPVLKGAPIVTKSNAIIYQGALNLGRGIELMIQTMVLLPELELWIAGGGDIEPALKQQVQELHLETRVKFLGRIPFSDLHAITLQARLGLTLEENLGKNYYYALPNKLFDYIQARIPVIVSNLPEMRKIIEDHGVGEVLMDRNPEILAALILKVLSDDVKITDLNNNLQQAARLLCWENEKIKVTHLFNKVFNS